MAKVALGGGGTGGGGGSSFWNHGGRWGKKTPFPEGWRFQTKLERGTTKDAGSGKGEE